MAVVPAPPTFTSGVLTSSQLNQLTASVQFLMNPPLAELRQTVAQSIPASTWTATLYDTEDVDTDVSLTGGHSTSVNTSRFTAVYAGWYVVLAVGSWAALATNRRGIRLAVNGSVSNASITLQPPTAAGTVLLPNRGKQVFLSVGDYVEVQLFQDSAGAVNTSVAAASETCGASIRWVSS